MTNPTPVTISEPVLLDLALKQVCDMLESSLSWLTKAYAKAEKRERLKDTGVTLYPAIYCGNGEYLSMFPDSELGNFCFFEIEDRQDVETMFKFSARFGLVFWFDFRTVFPAPLDHHTYTVEHVKHAVLTALDEASFLNVRITPTEVMERSENIYRGYSIAEIENQFQMRPYGAFRINGELLYFNNCP